MHVDDATVFIIEYLRSARNPSGFSSDGYDLFITNVVISYIAKVEGNTGHFTYPADNPRAKEVSPLFFEAAWHLCRHGVLRPSVRRLGEQGSATVDGYCLTTLGRRWIEQGAPALVILQPSRLVELFEKLSQQVGPGFLQRANEAVVCHQFGAYLGCCAMCGAAAESVLLSLAVAKSGDEGATLKTYRAANGRRNVIERIVGQARRAIADPFRSATELLSFWRNDAAHGLNSTISEIEAHEALARLVRFAQFVTDNWDELTTRAE